MEGIMRNREAVGLSEDIWAEIQDRPEGDICCPEDFQHLGNGENIKEAMDLLVADERLMELAKGMFTHTKLILDDTWVGPSVWSILRGLERRTGETIVSSGGMCANFLRLTKHVPVYEMFFTSGESRKFRRWATEFETKHVEPWLLAFGEEREGKMIRALASYSPETMEIYMDNLKMVTDVKWGKIANGVDGLPEWIRDIARRMSNGV
jgi:hypothetical protein